METIKIKVALAIDFFDALARIPRAQQVKVTRFIQQFQDNPTSPGINYEKIQNAKDPNLRSVRIDDTYRGIVSKPDTGGVYMLLWVDHHDEAYRWARHRICRINSETGSIQIFESRSEEVNKSLPTGTPGMFDHLRDRQLLKLGVPEEFLPFVRSIKSEEQLEKLESALPQEAMEALYMLAAGYTEEEVYLELDIPDKAVKVDTDDFRAALENKDTKRRFYVVEDELELQAILNAPLEKWRVFLHPAQRQLVERDWNGPVRVLGGAGTGKTVAALHRARWLATHRFFRKDERILFTTFTRNLAADIRENLKKICPVDVLKRIDVVNLDQWVLNYLRRNDYFYEIDYGGKSKELWETAMTAAPAGSNLPESFYKEEWEKVVQPQGITTPAQYYQASRIGRGTRINRKMRKEVWPVFEEYRILLTKHNLKEREDAIRDAALLLKQKSEPLPYKAIIVDEGQDMGMQAFSLIRGMIPKEQANDIFIVGDPRQKIYKSNVILSRCGINIRGRSRFLRLNYRTTEETRKWATAILEKIPTDDMDGGQHEQKAYRSLMHGSIPRIKSFHRFEEEIQFIKNYIDTLQKEGTNISDTCLVLRTTKLVEQYSRALQNEGIILYKIKRSEAEDRKQTGLRVATMHRVKGLEFEHIIIAHAIDGIIPLRLKNYMSEDPIIHRETEQIERSLLYVSATRARKDVLITYYGNSSPFLVRKSPDTK